MGFNQSHSGPPGDIDGCIQMLPGTYKNAKPPNITGIDEVHLKCDSIFGTTVNGCREPLLYSFALDKPTNHKIYKDPRIKLFKRINKSVFISYNILFRSR